MFKLHTLQEDTPHKWAIVHYQTELHDDDDRLINEMIDTVQDAYGEGHILTQASHLLETDPLVRGRFDLTAIQRTFRMGLPDPTAEGNKPPHLTNYRSETTELLAQKTLTTLYHIEFPALLQRGKTNPNQPILGFDGVGFLRLQSDEVALVLVQVKGTEDKRRPPGVAAKLIQECQGILIQTSAIARTLAVLTFYLAESPLQTIILEMMSDLGQGIFPSVIVAPVIVRGEQLAYLDDLKSLRLAAPHFQPAFAYGLALSLGVKLGDFGRIVMQKARLI